MWSLDTRELPSLHLEYSASPEQFPYAILSHTWERDEFSYKDLQSLIRLPDQIQAVQGRSGYKKILDCCRKASAAGFAYVWIDTCCIDKDSSADLSEAINSMYRWYESSKVCYVYLCDLASERHETTFESDFRQCRWFTRGWTLQELIAPTKVEFYNAGWKYVGSKSDLLQILIDITGIEAGILDNVSQNRKRIFLNNCSIAKKFSWASRRQTTRVEDRAYSLLGLFDINLPLLYGEGERAFERLQESIISRSDDHSILLWSHGLGLPSPQLLAPSPTCFALCDKIARVKTGRSIEPQIEKTKFGLKLRCPVVIGHDGSSLAVLNCRYEDDFAGPILLPLHHVSPPTRNEFRIVIKHLTWVARNFREARCGIELRLSTLNASPNKWKCTHDETYLGDLETLLLRESPADGRRDSAPECDDVINVVFRHNHLFCRHFQFFHCVGNYNRDNNTLTCNRLRDRNGVFAKGSIQWTKSGCDKGVGLILEGEGTARPYYRAGADRVGLMIAVTQSLNVRDSDSWQEIDSNSREELGQPGPSRDFESQTCAGNLNIEIADALIMGDRVYIVTVNLT